MARERPVALTVRGGGMAPLLADGERVEVASVRIYWPGDVIVFQAADLRLHVGRLLGYRVCAGRLACVTDGDGYPCHNAPVPFNRLLGRVVGPGNRGRLTGPSVRLRALLAFVRLALRR
ncbi:MAG TPA: S24/S26 family peptidase [Thermoanaerobaculia bacterium]